MNSAALCPSFPLRRLAVSRLRLALAASVAGHLLLVLGMAIDPLGGKSRSGAVAPLTVRLVPHPAAAAVAPALLEPETPIAAPRTRNRVPVPVREAQRATAVPGLRSIAENPPVSPPPLPDPAYYGARDLDDYPRPVAPLALDRIAEGITAPGRVTVSVRIDERGVVNEVDFPEPAVRDELKERLRATLAATRFLPARRDGRAVRSRLILGLDLPGAGRDP